MGIYINPADDTDAREKREKILAVGQTVDRTVFANHQPGFNNLYGVALVDNGFFVAAAVAYSSEEAHEFADPRDSRPITFTLLSFDAIEKLDPHAANMLTSWSGRNVNHT